MISGTNKLIVDMQEKEILQGYEIKNWEFGPRIYKIIAASTVLTLLPIIALAQTNMLSTSACDSPFVGTVCEVLDTVYAGTKILAKDTGYFEGDYEDIVLQDENELIWRDETYIEPKLVYPEGYFEIANRDELAMIRALADPDSGYANITPSLPPINPIAPPTPKYNAPRASNRGNKTPVYPTKKNKVLDGEIGDDPIGDLMAGNTGEKNGDNKTPVKTPEANKTPDSSKKPKNPLENQTAVKSDAINDKPINRQPLYDVADETLKRVEARQVDLGQEFIVRMNGVVTPDGMLDEEKSGWGKAEGDEPMIELAKIAISKVGVSGWLKYLSDKDANRLNIMFGQNDEQMIADIRSDLQTENKAKSTASALQAAKLIALNTSDLKEDEIVLLKAAKFTYEGRVLVIKFNLDKKIGQQIIAARLAEYKQKKAEEARKKSNAEKPSGSLDKASVSANAGE